MGVFDLAKRGRALSAKGDHRIVGGSGFAGSSNYRYLLSGSSFDYWREAGPIYDNSIAQLCLNFLWSKLPQLTLRFEKQTEPGIWKPDFGPIGAEYVLKAVNRPNDAYDGSTLWQATTLSHCCRGNGFWLTRTDRMGYPIGFWWAYNSQIRVLSNKDNADGRKLITHYEYTPVGGVPEPKDIDQVVHFRWGIDPLNPGYGLSPWLGQMREICTDNESATHMAALLRNGACPGIVLIPEVKTDEDGPNPSQRRKLTEIWKNFTRDNKGEPLMAPFPMKLERAGLSPEEMVLDKVRSIPAGRICGAIGIDPMVVAVDTQRQTFSNFEQGLKAALQNGLLPIAWLFSDQLSHQILPLFDIDPTQYRLGWNTDRLVGLQEDVDLVHKRWRENFRFGLVDRYTAKERIGEQPKPEDEGVYAAANSGNGQDDEPEKDKDKENENRQ